jgi:hypothetical protein
MMSAQRIARAQRKRLFCAEQPLDEVIEFLSWNQRLNGQPSRVATILLRISGKGCISMLPTCIS